MRMTTSISEKRRSRLRILTAIAIVGAIGLAPAAAAPAQGPPTSDPFDVVEDASTFDIVLRLKMPDDVLAWTHTGQLEPSMPYLPEGMKRMAEPKINGGIIVTGKLRDANDEIVAFASQHSAMPLTPDGKIAKMEWPSEWTVTFPGRGTLFLSEVEGPGRIFEIFQRYGKAKEIWTGNMQVRTTRGPTARGNGYVVGGTGEFLGKTGMFIEVNNFTRNDFTRPGRLPDGSIELRIRFN